jgi:cell division protein YceG involved in septum cleavage
MTQTAVEWLYVKMFENNGRITKEEYNQAKEMEREQIIKAYQQGVTDEHADTITFTTEGEDYYNTL